MSSIAAVSSTQVGRRGSNRNLPGDGGGDDDDEAAREIDQRLREICAKTGDNVHTYLGMSLKKKYNVLRAFEAHGLKAGAVADERSDEERRAAVAKHEKSIVAATKKVVHGKYKHIFSDIEYAATHSTRDWRTAFFGSLVKISRGVKVPVYVALLQVCAKLAATCATATPMSKVYIEARDVKRTLVKGCFKCLTTEEGVPHLLSVVPFLPQLLDFIEEESSRQLLYMMMASLGLDGGRKAVLEALNDWAAEAKASPYSLLFRGMKTTWDRVRLNAMGVLVRLRAETITFEERWLIRQAIDHVGDGEYERVVQGIDEEVIAHGWRVVDEEEEDDAGDLPELPSVDMNEPEVAQPKILPMADGHVREPNLWLDALGTLKDIDEEENEMNGVLIAVGPESEDICQRLHEFYDDDHEADGADGADAEPHGDTARLLASADFLREQIRKASLLLSSAAHDYLNDDTPWGVVIADERDAAPATLMMLIGAYLNVKVSRDRRVNTVIEILDGFCHRAVGKRLDDMVGIGADQSTRLADVEGRLEAELNARAGLESRLRELRDESDKRVAEQLKKQEQLEQRVQEAEKDASAAKAQTAGAGPPAAAATAAAAVVDPEMQGKYDAAVKEIAELKAELTKARANGGGAGAGAGAGAVPVTGGPAPPPPPMGGGPPPPAPPASPRDEWWSAGSSSAPRRWGSSTSSSTSGWTWPAWSPRSAASAWSTEATRSATCNGCTAATTRHSAPVAEDARSQLEKDGECCRSQVYLQ